MTLLKKLAGRAATPDKALRAIGDQARDAKNWQAASDAYQGYLEAHPDDADIWVQNVHTLKEQGLLTEAEAAYRRAASIAPANADARLHLAHLLKKLVQPRQAAAMFREVFDLAPTGEIITELQELGYSSDIRTVVESRPVQIAKDGRYLEVKDLFQYLSLHTTVTGITRVTLGLINYILEELDEAQAASYHFVHQYGDAEGVLLITKVKMRRIVQMAMSDTPDLPAMQALIGDIRATSRLIQLESGNLYLIVGAFWEFVANPSWIGGLRQRGVIVGAYIYDLIPITHAHYCMAALTDAFTAAFAETARLLNFALTISEFVAKQVTDYTARHDIKAFPTIAVPLAHELRFLAERTRRRLQVSSKLDELEDAPFVLCVCTIEARKNHIYLFYIWQRMIDAGLDVPDLVFVGRPGWRVQDLMDQVDASHNLGGRLHIMYGLSDEDLEALYDRCLFTVFPSFVEGWGLPVGESLARGKVCVASSTSSIPEVGGEFVIYVDPFNLDSGYKAISGLIGDTASLARREADLRARFVARTWKDVGKDFFGKINGVIAELGREKESRTVYAPTLDGGDILDVADMHNVGAGGAAYVANPSRLAFAEGWRAVEVSGTWMLDSTSKLRVQTNCPPGRQLAVLVHVGSSPWVTKGNTVRISASGPFSKRRGQDKATYTSPMRADADWWVRLKGEVDDLGCLTVYVRIEGQVVPADKYCVPVALRLHAVGYAMIDDVIARLTLLEQALLTLK